jgi:hypothetical protein
MMLRLSTEKVACMHGDHNPTTPCPIHARIAVAKWTWDTTQRMGMTDKQDRLARERKEIAARVAKFKATQEKFRREREEYFVTTLKNGQRSDSGFLRS